jgi:hypothetical protein
MQPWRIETTEVIDSVQQKIVNDVSFGSEVRIFATTLPQFFPSELYKQAVTRNRKSAHVLKPRAQSTPIACTGTRRGDLAGGFAARNWATILGNDCLITRQLESVTILND